MLVSELIEKIDKRRYCKSDARNKYVRYPETVKRRCALNNVQFFDIGKAFGFSRQRSDTNDCSSQTDEYSPSTLSSYIVKRSHDVSLLLLALSNFSTSRFDESGIDGGQSFVTSAALST